MKVLAGITLGVLLACLSAELALRLAGYENVVLTRFDADLGRLGRPNLRGMQNTEGRSQVFFNSRGYHDVDHSSQKAPGTFRIVILGDSFSAGVHVELENTYAQRLRSEMEKCQSVPGRQVEVVNLAVNGYNLHQIYLTEMNLVPEYSPDLLFVAITPNPGLLEPGAVEASLSPVVTFDGDTPLVSRSFRNAHTFKMKTSATYGYFIELSDHVRLLQFLMEAVFRTRTETSGLAKKELASENRPAPNQKSMERELAWMASRKLLDEIARLSKSRGVPIVFALAAPDEIDPVHAPTLASKERDARYESIFAELQLPLLTVASDMRSYAVLHQVYLNGFGALGSGTGHWNYEGNKVAAQLYASGLCKWLGGELARDGSDTRSIKQVSHP